MFGAFVDGVSTLAQLEQAENRQNDQQQHATGAQVMAQDFNSAQAIAQRDWSQMMSSTQYQRAVGDMGAAGLNPMLAYHMGGASSGPGASASSSGVGAGGSSPGPSTNVAAGMQAASQIAVNDALQDKMKAETDKTRAETDNVKETSGTATLNKAQMVENIKHTEKQILKTIQETNTSSYSAANLYQNTQNLQALIPQIKATIKHLDMQATHTGVLASEGMQRLTENLPKLKAALEKLEAKHSNLRLPQAGQRAAVYDSPLGALSEMMRALNPLIGIFGN